MIEKPPKTAARPFRNGGNCETYSKIFLSIATRYSSNKTYDAIALNKVAHIANRNLTDFARRASMRGRGLPS
jgi:hypothetical protein